MINSRTILASALPGCCVIVCLFASAQAATRYRFDRWTNDNGLPQNTVTSILQTRDGYLWLTTRDGLVRFDGIRFTVFDKGNSKGINSTRFSVLFEDRSRTLWAGTQDGGVTIYRAGQFVTYTSRDGLLDDRVVGIQEDESGAILVLTRRGIARFSDGKITSQTLYVEPFTVHGENEVLAELWHTDDNGLHRLAHGRIYNYDLRDGLSSRNIVSTYEDPRGVVWAATSDKGLNRIQDGKIMVYGVGQGLPANVKTARVLEDRKGNLWMPAPNGGLGRLAGGVFTTYNAGNGFINDQVRGMLEDREGNLWVG